MPPDPGIRIKKSEVGTGRQQDESPEPSSGVKEAKPVLTKETGERTLAQVKEEMESDECFEPIVLKLREPEPSRLPEQDLTQPALLLLKGKNIEKEDLRTRLHHGCVYKYFAKTEAEVKEPVKVVAHPTHMGTGGTRACYSCPWDDRLVMKFSPWDQSAEKAWLGKMSIKIQGAGTLQAEIEGRNGIRINEGNLEPHFGYACSACGQVGHDQGMGLGDLGVNLFPICPCVRHRAHKPVPKH